MTLQDILDIQHTVQSNVPTTERQGTEISFRSRGQGGVPFSAGTWILGTVKVSAKDSFPLFPGSV
jgi:hypothetical protein